MVASLLSLEGIGAKLNSAVKCEQSTYVHPDNCATWITLPQGFQNGVCPFLQFENWASSA
jgi:hypothetical protein